MTTTNSKAAGGRTAVLALMMIVGCSSPRLAVPVYVPPGADFTTFARGVGTARGLMVINPARGPSEDSEGYADAVKAARALGARVLGYVSTGRGDGDAAKIDQATSLYLSRLHVDGIFFDEAPGESNCAQRLPWYAARAAAAERAHPRGDAFIVVNPGGHTCEGFLAFADVIVVREESAAEVLAWRPQSWVARYDASRFWLLAYAASRAQFDAVRAHARASNVGWLYVTDDLLDNPWDKPPSYWDAEVEALRQRR